MASEAEQVKTVQVKSEENKTIRHNGLKVMGYFVPWWVVAVVIILIIYVGYDSYNQEIGQCFSKCLGIIKDNKVVSLNSPNMNMTGGSFKNFGPPVDTPSDIARIGSYFGRNNKW
jgi:hypothetical protein